METPKDFKQFKSLVIMLLYDKLSLILDFSIKSLHRQQRLVMPSQNQSISRCAWLVILTIKPFKRPRGAYLCRGTYCLFAFFTMVVIREGR